MVNELRFYTIDTGEFKKNINNCSDEVFISNAETFGNVYTQSSYNLAVKNGELKETTILRVIEVNKPIKSFYDYSVSSESIWASFDHGTVEAYDIDEAKELALIELNEAFEKVTLALNYAGNTLGFTIEFSKDNIQVTLQ